METKKIERLRDEIYRLLKERRLRDAFALLQGLVSETGVWELRRSLEEQEESYRLMIRYLFDGYDDPERPAVYRNLLFSLYSLTDRAVDRLSMQATHTLYYDTKRMQEHAGGPSLRERVDRLDTLLRNRSFQRLLPAGEQSADELQRLGEAIDREVSDLFKAIWTLPVPSDPDDVALLRELFQSDRLPVSIRAVLPSALLLALLQQYDPQLMLLLLEACFLETPEVSQRAIVAAMMVCYLQADRVELSAGVGERLQALQADERIGEYLLNIYLQLIRSRETEKISHRLTHEILPEMMKRMPRPGERNSKVEGSSDEENGEGNPEWEALFEQSGINEKLQELTELQLEGADVFLSTFSHLKQAPFFRDVPHWFLPFIPDHPALTPLFPGWSGEAGFKTMLTNSSFLCNSDKYSFALSLRQLPDEQRQVLLEQFSLEGTQMEQLEAEERMLKRDGGKRAVISNQYIQDLYRFFKLHPRRSEFRNPFGTPLNLSSVALLSAFFEDPKRRLLIAELYFKQAYYEEAWVVYEALSREDPMNGTLLQKCGYSLQKCGRIKEALELYLRAESLLPDNVWTLKQIALCYRRLEEPKQALLYYRKADRLQPDNPQLLLAQGHLLLSLRSYEEALQLYFKVSYLDDRSETALRAIAWSSFLSGKVKQAAHYYEKVLAGKPTGQDYLNAGHTAFAGGKLSRAVEYYLRALEAGRYDLERFLALFEADRHYLLEAGVPDSDVSVLLDQLFYRIGSAEG